MICQTGVLFWVTRYMCPFWRQVTKTMTSYLLSVITSHAISCRVMNELSHAGGLTQNYSVTVWQQIIFYVT